MLLALLGSRGDASVDGATVMRRLAQSGCDASASSVLARLVDLEGSGHVAVTRAGGYRFALTSIGEEAAYALGPGDPVELVLLMIDLVGFVSYTIEHGDAAAHGAARSLHDAGEEELAPVGGRVVKHLGDGLLGTARTVAAAETAAKRIAQRCARHDGTPWPMRASCHRGRPISFGGDLFGADVNLAARLCEHAQPDELVVSAIGEPDAELLEVRGLADPVPVRRVRLR